MMALEHVQDSTGSKQTTGGTINLTFGVAPTTGNLVEVMIGPYNDLGSPAPYWGVSGGGRFDVDQPALRPEEQVRTGAGEADSRRRRQRTPRRASRR